MSPTSSRPVDWEGLVQDNETRLYCTALAILGDPQEAEDAVQDAFVTYLEKAPEGLEHPSAWLTRVLVRFPEDGVLPETVDPEDRQEYDLSLYSIPWSESVPEEYRERVSFPVFRAEDLSLAVVEARGQEKDTGGLSFDFGVLFPSGVTVEYRCDGLTAQAVWAMVRAAVENF